MEKEPRMNTNEHELGKMVNLKAYRLGKGS